MTAGSRTNGWKQLISLYLVLSVVLAGAVSISPVLHVLVEHGGQGHAHSHRGFHHAGRNATHRVHQHPHPHDAFGSSSHETRVRQYAKKFPQPKLFGLQPQDFYRAMAGLVARVVHPLTEAPEGQDGKTHTHHSLAQMFVSGAVEGVWDVSPEIQLPAPACGCEALVTITFPASGFDPQSASRAPPARS